MYIYIYKHIYKYINTHAYMYTYIKYAYINTFIYINVKYGYMYIRHYIDIYKIKAELTFFCFKLYCSYQNAFAHSRIFLSICWLID